MSRLEIDADVLVLGGGPAGTWAALAAAREGARVVLADKGYCGTSGPTASGGNNLWNVPPGPARERSVQARFEDGGRLSEPAWMYRVLEETHQRVDELAGAGYRFPSGDDGREVRTSLQGPEYMRRMRRRVHRAGGTILDHSPALELLTTGDGIVSGAAGLQRQNGYAPWSVRAGAVVVATGGCAFLSGSFGTNVDTGDGLLMAAEVGASFSGMEFSTAYALAPAWSGHTKGLMMQFATYYDADGRTLGDGGFSARGAAMAHLAAGRPVFARLDRARPDIRAAMRTSQPNYFLPLDKAGIDPFTQKYPVRAVLEGTVRGTGGIRVAGTDCASDVPGLFVAGDAATRELVTGGRSGGGSHNGAWAISSGTWAGAGAARFARKRPVPDGVRGAGAAGLRGPSARRQASRSIVGLVQEHTLPLRRSYRRSATSLQDSVTALDEAWSGAADLLGGSERELLQARSAAAMLAVARWATHSALARTETRGMHVRTDLPDTDPAQTRRLLSGGLGEVWVRPERGTAEARTVAS
ncbi:pyridine nucleotide-disulfide oxidoreductase [Rhodococcus sp. SC4]|uniref:FAD-binding protein n=1 Tax=Rhodococcus sp. LB1 TaxID=1807499 RepID=UPI00076AC508|nr:FAD-binding protein [Rhodococcus sp. LB1]KXF56710.1 pyridine nucleotide-disulfide oxidoreductase [Rhodococcus sp. SC4]KXX59028.1 pyridine nucleotide-disulfide oxidoreductase [Rhodococcus sp. LB1]RZK83789.1 MAG: FAD-dependent oxidoreductase [Rhodococcus sp. (in: high G+C Gram-positive bacteria)]